MAKDYRDFKLSLVIAILIPTCVILAHNVILVIFMAATGIVAMEDLLPMGLIIRVLLYVAIVFAMFWSRGFRFPIGQIRGVRTLNIIGIAMGLAAVVYFILAPIVESVVTTSEELDEIFEVLAAHPMIFMALATVIAPLFEELIFRGMILGGLLHKYGDTALALVISSLLFGAFHMNMPQFIIASVVGMCCGAIYMWTGSLLYSIVFHAFYNLLVSLITYFFTFLGLSGVLYFGAAAFAVVFVALQLYLLRAATQ